MEKQTFVVCFHDDGHIETATLEEYRADIDRFKGSTDSTPGFYCLSSIDAVNKETATAIALTGLLNDNACIDELLKHYLEAHSWSIDSTDEVNPGQVKGLDRLLSTFARDRDKRKSPLADMLEVIKPCRWDPSETESELINEWRKKPEFIEVASSASRRHRAFVRCAEDIPAGWIRASDLPSPGQIALPLPAPRPGR